MSAAPFYFRRRAIGRAASPPTWACYEQIPFDEDDDDYSESDSESCSEDDEDYSHPLVTEHRNTAHGAASDSEDSADLGADTIKAHEAGQDMVVEKGVTTGDVKQTSELTKVDIKGKQRAIDPPTPESTKRQRRRKQRKSSFTLRPILTIQRSQGFVWNQDLFVPPYIKDRYVASTSPPNYDGFTCSGMNDNYEVEVVEIRVGEGDLKNIIP